MDAIGIIATNIERSIRFYRLFGLRFPDPKKGEDHVEAKTASGLRVMLDSEELIKKLKPGWVKPVGQRMAMAFLCDSAKDVDQVYAKITSEGFEGETAPWDAFWGQRYASVRDPDGNSVDLFAPL